MTTEQTAEKIETSDARQSSSQTPLGTQETRRRRAQQTTQYVLDTAMRKQIQIIHIRMYRESLVPSILLIYLLKCQLNSCNTIFCFVQINQFNF
jgi:hypothetical protein